MPCVEHAVLLNDDCRIIFHRQRPRIFVLDIDVFAATLIDERHDTLAVWLNNHGRLRVDESALEQGTIALVDAKECPVAGKRLGISHRSLVM